VGPRAKKHILTRPSLTISNSNSYVWMTSYYSLVDSLNYIQDLCYSSSLPLLLSNPSWLSLHLVNY
jgi:hypothetical protein